MPAGAIAETGATPAPGWRLESSLGLQISVPAHWAVNDYGCNMSQQPTVVRGQGAQMSCLTPETPEKQLAWLGKDGGLPLETLPGASARAVTLDGVAGERVEGRASDGRFVGWLRLPARQQLLVVKVLDEALLRRILDSAKLVPVDHNGCPELRPIAPKDRPARSAAALPLAPERPRSVAICYYGSNGDQLLSSALLVGDAARDVADRLNRSAPGPNPDTDPKQCLHLPAPPPADAVLLLGDAHGSTTIHVSFSGCTGRRLDNGLRQAHVSASLLKAILTPLHTGYGFNGELPP